MTPTQPSLGILWFLAGALVLLNLLVWVAAVRSRLFTKRQIIFQAAIVWVLPVFGAIVVGVMIWNEFSPDRRMADAAEPGEAPGPDGHMMDGGGHGP